MSDIREIECRNCGSVYRLYKRSLPMKDEDSETCEVCGEELISWRGSYMYIAELIERVVNEDLAEEQESCDLCGENDPDTEYHHYPIGEENGEIIYQTMCNECYSRMNGYGYD